MSEKVDELVTFEQISDVTFEQIDELAKEIYVQLVKDKANELVDLQGIEDKTDEAVKIVVNDKFAHNLSTQAYKIAEQWFLSKNKRIGFYRNSLIQFYANQENRMNCEKWLNKLYSVNPKDDGEKLKHLKENSCYLVIKASDNTNTPIVAFYYGESNNSEPYYLFQEPKSESAEKFSIKAIFLEEI